MSTTRLGLLGYVMRALGAFAPKGPAAVSSPVAQCTATEALLATCTPAEALVQTCALAEGLAS